MGIKINYIGAGEIPEWYGRKEFKTIYHYANRIAEEFEVGVLLDDSGNVVEKVFNADDILASLAGKVSIKDYGPLGKIARLGCFIKYEATSIGAKVDGIDHDLSRQCMHSALRIFDVDNDCGVMVDGKEVPALAVKLDLQEVAASQVI